MRRLEILLADGVVRLASISTVEIENRIYLFCSFSHVKRKQQLYAKTQCSIEIQKCIDPASIRHHLIEQLASNIYQNAASILSF